MARQRINAFDGAAKETRERLVILRLEIDAVAEVRVAEAAHEGALVRCDGGRMTCELVQCRRPPRQLARASHISSLGCVPGNLDLVPELYCDSRFEHMESNCNGSKRGRERTCSTCCCTDSVPKSSSSRGSAINCRLVSPILYEEWGLYATLSVPTEGTAFCRAGKDNGLSTMVITM